MKRRVRDEVHALPFTLRLIDVDIAELMFTSTEGNIIAVKKITELYGWMNLRPSSPLFFPGYPIWMIQKKDRNTLIICFCSEKNLIYPQMMSIGDFGLAIIKLQKEIVLN